jgi:hypothetical protein
VNVQQLAHAPLLSARHFQDARTDGSDAMNARTVAIWRFSEMNSKSIGLTARHDRTDAPSAA